MAVQVVRRLHASPQTDQLLNMYLLLVHYTQPLEKIAEVTPEHRAYLDRFYASGQLLVSGRRQPPTGGVILGHFKDRKAVDAFVAGDPFVVHGVARYEVFEFDPVKRCPELEPYLRRVGALGS